jgi:hypothetical protein
MKIVAPDKALRAADPGSISKTDTGFAMDPGSLAGVTVELGAYFDAKTAAMRDV